MNTTATSVPSPAEARVNRDEVLRAWSTEFDAARAARAEHAPSAEWRHLERAHILSQAMAWPHIRTHLAMLEAGVRRRDGREVLGQLARIVLAAPGSLSGKYPSGNTGAASVSAFAPMPIPDDLQAILDGSVGVHASSPESATFPTDISGLDEWQPPAIVDLEDGDTFTLRIAPVVKQIGDARVRMLAYNGSIPGPTIRAPQGSEIVVRVRNDGDTEATVHWHGLRLQNEYDGVPHETQEPIAVGDEFTYRVRVPDPGLYWYHPHIREDYGLEMGLYGNLVVVPTEPDYWPRADREVVLTLDDVLIEDGRMASFLRSGPTHVAMGRFGNVMLTAGETDFAVAATAGEVTRFFLTNTANTRIFNITLPGARMKLIGGDSGRNEHEVFVEEVLLSPSERAVVDVMFDRSGSFPLEYRAPDRTYVLARVDVEEGAVEPDAVVEFERLRTNDEFVAERQRLEDDLRRPPDKTLAFESRMPMLHDEDASDHPHEHGHGMSDGLEWEDAMPEMNRMSDSCNMIWKLVDRDTGKANWEIDWAFRVGDRVKIRLVNDMNQDHPMHHPFHIHGAGRFLVISRDGAPEPNLVWKDTVLVRAGESVDIMLDVSNAGLWMAHCHIAEHNQSGMMFSFPVSPAEGG
jgi:FtsP/CotA-like multicopper oxidase with cupredoxin domain